MTGLRASRINQMNRDLRWIIRTTKDMGAHLYIQESLFGEVTIEVIDKPP